MDQVTLPRAKVQQVLVALEGGMDSWRLIGPAIDALRAALEQPEQEAKVMVCGVDCFPKDKHCNGCCVGKTDDSPPALKKDDWTHLKRYGYAPGNYMSKCHRCGDVPVMDKRATTCRPCAEAMHAAALEQPKQCSCGDRPKDQCPGEWEPGCDLGNNPAFARRVALEQEPVATVKVMGSYNGVPALGCLIDASATHVKRGDRLYTHPPRREPLTVTDLQQALVDVDLVDPDAIDDPDGFDNGFTLQQIDALHRRLMQTTPPTTTTQPEPK